MSEAFDPYRKWLGIPPAEQPPNHYRLLGIALFEDDPDVITHAADRQMAHLRTFQSGKHRDESQKILNEVSAARLCLLSAEKKAAYDAQLKEELAPPVPAAAAPPPAAGPPLPPNSEVTPPPSASTPSSIPQGSVPQGKAVAVGVPASPAAPVVRTANRPRTTSYARGRKKKSSPLPMIIIAICAGVAGVAVLLFLVLGGNQTTPTEQPARSQSTTSTTPPKSQPSERPRPQPGTRPRTTSPNFEPLASPDPAPAQPQAPIGSFSPVEGSRALGNPMTMEEINAQSIEIALAEAREQLNARNAKEAKRKLEGSRDEAKKIDREADVVHLTVLADYVDSFLNDVRRGMRNKLEPGESYEFRGDTVELVSVNEETGEVTYKFNGTEATHKPDEVPTRPAIVFAWKSFERENIDPFSYVLTAAFLRFDAKSSMPENQRLELAKKYWLEAKESGATDKYVADELGIPTEDLGSASPPSEAMPETFASDASPAAPMPIPVAGNAQTTPDQAQLPDSEALEAARFELGKTIRDRFGRSIPAAAKEEVVEKLLEQIDQSTDPAKQYVMWEKAVELTCERGDAAKLGELLTAWTAAQPVDYLTQLGEAVPRCRPASSESAMAHLTLAREGYSQARQAQRFDLALKLAEAALKTAVALKDTEAVTTIRADMEMIEQQQEEAQAVDSAL